MELPFHLPPVGISARPKHVVSQNEVTSRCYDTWIQYLIGMAVQITVQSSGSGADADTSTVPSRYDDSILGRKERRTMDDG